MKMLMLSTISLLALVTTAGGVGISSPSSTGIDPTGMAEMWQINGPDGAPEHVYIRTRGGLIGPGGKKLTDRSGKVIETWGFYFRPQSNHGQKVMLGLIRAPDPLAPLGSRVLMRCDDPVFEQALAVEIKASEKHLPEYTWGNSKRNEYVCWDWAKDMWNRAQHWE